MDAGEGTTGELLFLTERYPLITDATLERHFSSHQTLLAPFAGEVATDAKGDTCAILCKLAYVPTEWAPYFFNPLTPQEALKTTRALRDTLPEGDRQIADPLLNWAKVAAMQKARRRSSASRMALGWQTVNPDWKLVR